MKSLFVAAIIYVGLVINCAPSVAWYEPSKSWQTREGAILCDSYFAIKDAEAAARANDPSWLQRTGCLVAASGLRVVVIEAPRSATSEIWRVHVYLNDGSSSDAYIRGFNVVNFARGAFFKNLADLEKNWKQMNDRYFHQFGQQLHSNETMPHRADVEGAGFRLLIGPGSSQDLSIFCEYARDRQETIQEYFARSKADNEQFNKTLEFRESKPPTGPKYVCDEPVLN